MDLFLIDFACDADMHTKISKLRTRNMTLEDIINYYNFYGGQ